MSSKALSLRTNVSIAREMSPEAALPTRREAAHLHAYRLRLTGFVNGVDVSSELQQSLEEGRREGWDDVVMALLVSEVRSTAAPRMRRRGHGQAPPRPDSGATGTGARFPALPDLACAGTGDAVDCGELDRRRRHRTGDDRPARRRSAQDGADDLADMLLRTGPYDAWSTVPVHDQDSGPYPTLLPYVLAQGKRRGGAPEAVLTAVAEGLADLTPPLGLGCRVGADEFVALHDGLVELDRDGLQHDVESWVQRRHRLHDIPMSVRPSVALGIASGPASARSLTDADRRMYDAKQNGGGSSPTRRTRMASTVDRRQGPRSIERPVVPSLPGAADPVSSGTPAPSSAQDSGDPARERAHQRAYTLAMIAQSDEPTAAESIEELTRLAEEQGWPEVFMAARYATCIHDLWNGDPEAPGKVASFLAKAIEAQMPGFEALGRLLEVQISSAQGQVDVFLEQVATITLLLREPGIHLLEEVAGLINQGEEFSALRLWEPQEHAARRADELTLQGALGHVALTGVAAVNRLEAVFHLAMTQIELGELDAVRTTMTRSRALLEEVERFDLPAAWMLELRGHQEFLGLFIEDRDASPTMLDTAARLRADGVESIAFR